MRLTRTTKAPSAVLATASAVALVLGLAACGSDGGDSDDQTYNFQFSSFQGEGGAQGQLVKWYFDEVDKRTDGRVTAELFWTGSLVPAEETVPALQDGRVEMAQGNTAYSAPEAFPLTNVWSIPFTTDNVAAVNATMADLYTGSDLPKEFENQNMHLLTWLGGTPNVTGSEKQIASLEDFKGKKVRAVGYTLDALDAVGADPIALTVNEIYEALERGTIDAYSSMIFDVIADFKFYEPAKYVLDDGQGFYNGTFLAINKDVWDDLPDDLQAVMTEVGQEAQAKLIEIYSEVDAKACQTIKDNGGTVTALPDSEVEKWKDLVGDGPLDKWASVADNAGFDSGAFRQEFLEELAKNEAKFSDYRSGVRACVG